MPFSIFETPQVLNWKQNIADGNDKYFWDEAIYYFTAIYDSFEPFMRLCVDWRIDGKKPEEIAKITKKDVQIIKKTLFRAKRRLKKAVF